MWNFRVSKTDRIDRLLRGAKQPGSEWLSRAAYDELIVQGHVMVNGKRVKKAGEQVPEGAEITVQIPQLGLLRADRAAELLWSDPARTLAIFQKPAGIPSYPLLPWENGTLANQVSAFLAQNSWMTESEFASLAEPPKLEGGLLQRLDRDTSGLLAVALNSKVKEDFRQAFTAGKFRKTYLAIVSGNPSGKHSFDLRDAAGGKAQAFVNPNGSSTLEVKVRGEKDGFSLVEVATAQGSRHIVRACLSVLGSPLVGDAAYGGNCSVAPFHQLHAFRIKLLEPSLFRDFPNSLEAPLPQSFLDCLANLGLH